MMEKFKLYGILNTETGKLVNDLTNPKHKFWESQKRADSALGSYSELRAQYNGNIGIYDKTKLKIVTITCTMNS